MGGSKSLKSLEENAKSCLENSESFPALEKFSELETVFRVWRYPALRTHSSWILHEKNQTFRVRRLEWDRNKDLSFPQNNPTIYGSEATVSTEDARNIINEFRSLALQPFLITPQFGIDGETVGVETKSGYLNCRLSWWGDAPESWSKLSEWLEGTTNYFDSILPQSTAKMNDSKY